VNCKTREGRSKEMAELIFMWSESSCRNEYGITLSNKESAVARLRLSNEVKAFHKTYHVHCGMVYSGVSVEQKVCCYKVMLTTLQFLNDMFDNYNTGYNAGLAFCNNLR